MKKVGFIVLIACIVSSFMLGSTITAKTSFKDIPSNFWAKEDIDFLNEKKIINGYPDGKFGPNDTIRRIDAATMIVRALDLDTANPPNPRFADVTRDSKGFDIIATVVAEGIFTGRDGKFYPNDTLTRAEMAAIINRAYNLEKKNTKVSFKDVPATYWGYKDIQALVENEITTGYEDNTFKPNKPTTRAEFSAFMTRVIKNIDQTGDSEENPSDKENPDDKEEDSGSQGNAGGKEEPRADNFEVINIF